MILQAELPHQFLDTEFVMGGDRFEHSTHQRAGLQRFVCRHGDVVGAVHLRCEADM